VPGGAFLERVKWRYPCDMSTAAEDIKGHIERKKTHDQCHGTIPRWRSHHILEAIAGDKARDHEKPSAGLWSHLRVDQCPIVCRQLPLSIAD
jgi:hypothetical protein